MSEDKSCIDSGQNRIMWYLEGKQNGKKTFTATAEWSCYCSAGNPSQKTRPGMYFQAFNSPLHELCKSNGDCSGCAPTCKERDWEAGGEKVCHPKGEDEKAWAKCHSGLRALVVLTWPFLQHY